MQDPAGRVATARALGNGPSKTSQYLSPYWAIPGAPCQAKGKPPYRIQAPLEKVIRQRIVSESEGESCQRPHALAWLSEHYQGMIRRRRGGRYNGWALSMGHLGASRHCANGMTCIARREYLRTKLANRSPHGGTVRPKVHLDESYVNVNHSTPRTWYCAEKVHEMRNRGPRPSPDTGACGHHGWMGGGSPTGLPSEATDGRLSWPEEH